MIRNRWAVGCGCCDGLFPCAECSRLMFTPGCCPPGCAFMELNAFLTDSGGDPICEDIAPRNCIAGECVQAWNQSYLLKRSDNRTYRRAYEHDGVSVEVTLTATYDESPWPQGLEGVGEVACIMPTGAEPCSRLIERIVIAQGGTRRFEAYWPPGHNRVRTGGTCRTCQFGFGAAYAWYPRVFRNTCDISGRTATLTVAGVPPGSPDTDCCDLLNRTFNLVGETGQARDCNIVAGAFRAATVFVDACADAGQPPGTEYQLNASVDFGAAFGGTCDPGGDVQYGTVTASRLGGPVAAWRLMCQNRSDPYSSLGGMTVGPLVTSDCGGTPTATIGGG